MTDAGAYWITTISAMALAYGTGDNPRGEELLLTALDLGAPWDVVTSAAARALIEYRSGEGAPSKPDGFSNGPALTRHIVAVGRIRPTAW